MQLQNRLFSFVEPSFLLPICHRSVNLSRTQRPNWFILSSTAVTSVSLRPIHQTRASIAITIAALTKRPKLNFFKRKIVQRIRAPLIDSGEVLTEDESVHHQNGNVVEIDAEGGVWCCDIDHFSYPTMAASTFNDLSQIISSSECT